MKTRIFSFTLLVLMICGNVKLHAQQQAMFTQYMFNGLAINPAYAGSHESLSLTAVAREQWVGVDGAPSTQTISLHSPIKGKRASLGLMMLNDKIGITKHTGFYGMYAYRLPLAKGKLAFGVQGGFGVFNNDYQSVSTSDPNFQENISETEPNFGFGVRYTNDNFYLGISSNHIIETTLSEGSVAAKSKLVRHYFVNAGRLYTLTDQVKVKPNILLKFVPGAPVEADVNVNFLFVDVLWLGVSLRTFETIDGIMQVQLTPQLQLGYSYDFPGSNGFKQYHSGSHEVSLNYRFTFEKSKIITPRYF